jgi:hypothetical protein
MSLNKTISIKTKEGHNYLIDFSKFDSLVLPTSFNKDLIEVVIAIDDNKGINNAKTLFTFSKHIKTYLTENDVILYCFCDNKAIDVADRNKIYTPQEHRSLLFKRMFDRACKANFGFINKPIELIDSNSEKHYIHLFTRIKNIKELEIIIDEVTKIGK